MSGVAQRDERSPCSQRARAGRRSRRRSQQRHDPLRDAARPPRLVPPMRTRCVATSLAGDVLDRERRQPAQVDDAHFESRVVDLRWLAPLPIEDIAARGRRDQRVLVVDETRRTGGVSEGIVADARSTPATTASSRALRARTRSSRSGDAATLVLLSEDEIEAAALGSQDYAAARRARPDDPFGDTANALRCRTAPRALRRRRGQIRELRVALEEAELDRVVGLLRCFGEVTSARPASRTPRRCSTRRGRRRRRGRRPARSSRLAQVGEDRPLVVALLDRARELREGEDRDSRSRASTFSCREICDTSCTRFSGFEPEVISCR